ncbi:MAG: YihY/virulence factor BrkB family protein [Marinifilaceae bacterium]|jgi:membrane protein|nr:YihY/virulence factor BrkB family protein [Marinifilaceae bacterium]
MKVINNLVSTYKKYYSFFDKEIWLKKTSDYNGVLRYIVLSTKVLMISIRTFLNTKCNLRASALTYFSLLSVVPVLAMGFGIAKGFGLEKVLENELKKNLSGQKEILEWLINFANKMLENTQFSLITGLGFVILFWSVVKLLGNIENNFNQIWKIKKQRSINRKFSDYTAVMIFAPILFIGSSASTLFISTKLKLLLASTESLEVLSPFVTGLISFAPMFLAWLLFASLYIFMPNRRVKPLAGILAGVLSGTAFQLFQVLYIQFQSHVTTYNAVYGSFAALPLFLIWLQLSWLIVLFGACFSYSVENVNSFYSHQSTEKLTINNFRLISLEVCRLLLKLYKENRKNTKLGDISQKLNVPMDVLEEIFESLQSVGLVAKLVSNDDDEFRYQPAFDLTNVEDTELIEIIENNTQCTYHVSN